MLSEKNYLGDVLKLEIGEQQLYSRDKITLITGQNLLLGTILGKITLAATISETHAGNTGNGVFTADVTSPVLANARLGVYTVKLITAATNGGTFRVFDPLGREVGEVAVGATFADQIKFVIADGATDFIVGDTFLVTVGAGSLKYKALGLTSTDGSQDAIAILAQDTDATSADVATIAIARNAAVADNKLIWPGSISAAQKAAATAQLAALGIVIRTGV